MSKTPEVPTDGPQAHLYRPDFDPYSGMTKQEYLDKWWDPEVGDWRYPSPEEGAPHVNGFDRTPRPNTIEKDAIIDRLGKGNGNFASPDGTPFEQRALPPSSVDRRPYVRYKVVKPLPDEVLEGRAHPWFGQTGGGVQYYFQRVWTGIGVRGIWRS